MNTITGRILERHVSSAVEKDEIVFARIDRVMTMDHISSLAREIDALGMPIKEPHRLIVAPDHNVPANTAHAADNARIGREFVRRHGIENYFEVGRGGICHLLVPERGLLLPGQLAVGTDSHSCTYGALCAFATGVGIQDAVAALVTGELWLRVPRCYKIVLKGALREHVQGKDVALALVHMLGVGGAIYKALEIGGEGLASMGISDRISVSNMAVEMGAKAALFECDDVLRRFYMERHGIDIPYDAALCLGNDEAYERVIELDLSQLEPMVAPPPLPSNGVPARTLKGVRIDQAFVGSCSNGSIEDMRMAARALNGRKVADHVRMIVLPGTQRVFAQMVDEGLTRLFTEAGALVGPATCGPCSGTHMGLLGEGEVCVATTNRNFVGRMGARSSSVFLANPAVVAASAVAGEIALPQQMEVGR